MNNTVYTYDRITSDESYRLRDFTSYYYGGLQALFDQYPQYFEYVDVDDNLKIEVLAYTRYGAPDFADVILACNSEVFLWSMPYNTDVLIEQKEALAKILVTELGINTSDPRFEDFQVFLDFIDEDVESRNTDKRTLRVPKVRNMSDVVNLIKTYRRANKIDQYEES